MRALWPEVMIVSTASDLEALAKFADVVFCLSVRQNHPSLIFFETSDTNSHQLQAEKH